MQERKTGAEGRAPGQEAVAYLQGLGRFGMRLGLERIRGLLERLGHPEEGLPPVYHITGTNGKGSTASLMEAILRAAGYRTALFTSPHLVHYEERFRFDGRPVSGVELAAAVEQVRRAAAALAAGGGVEPPTEFEVATAVFFLLVQARRPDAVVLEVGLGGRYDATNTVPRPMVAVVTNVALDHTDRLGPTVEAIAYDKAGIARPGVPLVTGALDPAALAVLRREAAALGAPLWEVRPEEAAPEARDPRDQGGPAAVATYRLRSAGPDGSCWDYRGPAPVPARWDRLPLALAGPHQVANAAVAVTALLAAAATERGLPVTREAVERGLAAARWPGRMERVRWRGREIWLDGAHNPAGMAALARTVAALWPDRRVVLVAGMLDDKDVEKAAAAIAPVAARAVVTEPPSPRAARAERLAGALAAHGVAVAVQREPLAALERALQEAGPGQPVLVCGSLYLVGTVRAQLLVPTAAPGG
ncbi:bifunctional folylpolyglutamate synthase/dihydrofolate synthase [Thermaerobacter subterraneus]|uniref:tetrahydrofolate synthase n=1 Tax=Thermaerobacter subterraneus DSM 13965 TaxID=867903 RepID=K6Q0F5_9FIRM|nr:folylpolyglutamate synthase/dihydrofolate synthase family protein [Thermaerobacter subterraneus]EKP94558.1 folylpolyglutamate synthase/dihydrofolate synthase [Thermaerobacter subterraneus DSM 13965]